MFWTSKHPHSLALRLSAWYAGSAFLLLVAGTGFLYWELVQSSNEEDDQYLAEKANTLRKLISESDFRTLKWEVEGESSVRPAVEVLSRVFSSDGRIDEEISSGEWCQDLPSGRLGSWSTRQGMRWWHSVPTVIPANRNQR